MFVFTVVSGPDIGKTERFELRSVVVGRGSDAEFAISDRLAAPQHGRVYHVDDALWYEDLGSRYGTVVEDAAGTATLHSTSQSVRRPIRGDARILIGETIISVQYFSMFGEEPTRLMAAELLGAAESLSIDKTVRLTELDQRLVALFQLAGGLWQATDAESALAQGTDALLRAFPGLLGVEITTIAQTRWPAVSRAHWRAPYSPCAEDVCAEIAERCRSTAAPSRSARSADDSRSRIAIPMQTNAGAVGSILLVGSAASPLLRSDIDIAEAIGTLITAALERIRLEVDVLAMFEGIVSMCVAAVDARDPATAGHSARVAELALRLFDAHAVSGDAEADATRRETLRYAALLHDIGKIAVREDVLMKSARLSALQHEVVLLRAEAARSAILAGRRLQGPMARNSVEAELEAVELLLATVAENLGGKPLAGAASAVFREGYATRFVDSRGHLRTLLSSDEHEALQVERGTLTEGERGEMQAHVEHTRRLLNRIPWPAAYADVPSIAALHHEKLDGSGYPLGLDARALPREARMLTIADIFDAMAGADRIYRPAASKEIAAEALLREARGGSLDEGLVDLFVQDVIVAGSVSAVRKTG
jgi:HD-GYP domain-containing protein (c-di-GMP phosphodiesterase class II)